MSRTHKDAISQNYERYKDAPYWKYKWHRRHGNKRSAASTRRVYVRLDRHRAKEALRLGEDPPRVRRYLKWIYW